MNVEKHNYDFYVLEAVLTQSELDDVFARFICNQPIQGQRR